MREPINSDAEVVEAGDRILARGKPVTGTALRRELGNVGNVKRLHDVWVAHRQSQVAVQSPIHVPADLAAIVESAIGRLGADLTTLASSCARLMNDQKREEVERVRSAFAAKEMALEEQFADAASLIDDLEMQLTAANERAEDLEAEVGQLREKNAEQQVLIARLEERGRNVETMLEDQELARSELRESLAASTALAGQLLAMQAAQSGSKAL